MLQSQKHLQAAKICTAIELINGMLLTADPIQVDFLKQQKEIELRKYSDLLEDIIKPLNLVG